MRSSALSVLVCAIAVVLRRRRPPRRTTALPGGHRHRRVARAGAAGDHHARRARPRDRARDQAARRRCGSTASWTKRSIGAHPPLAATPGGAGLRRRVDRAHRRLDHLRREQHLRLGAVLGFGAARALDRERAPPRHQPAPRQNDHFGVMFDTFYDRRSGFLFYTNPLGALCRLLGRRRRRSEHRLEPGLGLAHRTLRRRLDAWRWRSRSRRSATARARTRSGAFQLRRSIRHKNEWTYLTPVPQNLAGPQAFNRISSGGTLVGLDLPPASRNVELKPYADRARRPPIGCATPPLSQRLRSRRRRRREVRRDGEPDGRFHRQHRLRAGRNRRAAGQPHALQPVLPGEARLLPRGARHVRLRARRRGGAAAGSPPAATTATTRRISSTAAASA